MTEVHPNAMAYWPTIGCDQHTAHASFPVHVELGGPTPYHDYCPIPMRFARSFDINVYEWKQYRDVQGYCPAHDAVSETVQGLGIWEPRETTLVLSALTAAAEDSCLVDFGSQIGWFSLLAASCDREVVAFEADPSNVEMLESSLELNNWDDGRVVIQHERVRPDSPVLDLGQRIAVAKLDIEGAEDQAIRMLWPAIERGEVDHLMIEMSPVFADFYPQLAVDLVDAGYRMHLLPDKQIPPAPLDDLPHDLGPNLAAMPQDELRVLVASWDQRDVWFYRDGAPWA